MSTKTSGSNHRLVINFRQNLLKQETRKLVILKASQYIQKLKELITWGNLHNFQLFASNFEENRKLRKCWVAKNVMSHTFFVKFRVFRREFLRNHSVYRALSFSITDCNCHALSIFRGFVLSASADNDENMSMRQKM